MSPAMLKRTFWVSLIPVGRIKVQRIQRLEVPTPLPCTIASSERRAVDNTTPNLEPHLVATAVSSDDGASSLLPSPHLDPLGRTNNSPNPSVVIDSHERAWQRLINPAISHYELRSLIGAIFSDGNATEIIDHVRESDAQTFIDVIDEVRHHTFSF